MAKQRRPPPKPVRTPTAVPARPNTSANDGGPPPPAQPSGPPRRSTYFEAVALYERGLESLQRHDYRGAGEQFESVLRQYPEEKELHERVRLYLNICKRQATTRLAAPQTLEERL